jgi:hypothetical protein
LIRSGVLAGLAGFALEPPLLLQVFLSMLWEMADAMPLMFITRTIICSAVALNQGLKPGP